MQKGIDFSYNYIYLVKKNSNVKLKVDFEFYSMLLNAERGIPMLYVNNDMVKRM
jgi:ribosome-associated toxin RatA of RatAB toxin-antitoxin module